MGISNKLSNIQTELKCQKSQFNSFGKYKYRSCEDIFEAAKPLLKKHGCILTITDSIEHIGDRYYVKATATLTDTETGETVCNNGYARETETKSGQDQSQITGTASSYARKYCLNGLFLIDDTKDADTDEYQHQSNQSKGVPVEDQRIGELKGKAVIKEIEKRGISVDTVLKLYKVDSIAALSNKQLVNINANWDKIKEQEGKG